MYLLYYRKKLCADLRSGNWIRDMNNMHHTADFFTVNLWSVTGLIEFAFWAKFACKLYLDIAGRYAEGKIEINIWCLINLRVIYFLRANNTYRLTVKTWILFYLIFIILKIGVTSDFSIYGYFCCSKYTIIVTLSKSILYLQ